LRAGGLDVTTEFSLGWDAPQHLPAHSCVQRG